MEAFISRLFELHHNSVNAKFRICVLLMVLCRGSPYEGTLCLGSQAVRQNAHPKHEE